MESIYILDCNILLICSRSLEEVATALPALPGRISLGIIVVGIRSWLFLFRYFVARLRPQVPQLHWSS